VGRSPEDVRGPVRLIAFAGYSGAGKTTLLEALVRRLVRDGLRVGYLKSAHHPLAAGDEGKDTGRLRAAGAHRPAAIPSGAGADPSRLLAAYADCDLLLAEGFKGAPVRKIEVFRDAPLLPADAFLLAVVRDDPDPRPRPRFARGDIDGLAAFVAAWRAE
jgi:molybdopterin-guanine dinucleotide biosynthesis protein B